MIVVGTIMYLYSPSPTGNAFGVVFDILWYPIEAHVMKHQITEDSMYQHYLHHLSLPVERPDTILNGVPIYDEFV